jgi:large subunit ribosomal protein L25
MKNCVVRELQIDPLSREPIHVDLMGVSMTEKLTVAVPIHLTGVPDGVKKPGRSLSQILREIEIECLPADIPKHLEFDVSALQIGDTISVKSIHSDKFVVVGDLDRIIATVAAPRIVETVEPRKPRHQRLSPNWSARKKEEKEEEKS